MQRPPARLLTVSRSSTPNARRTRPTWSIVVGASAIVGLLAGGIVALSSRSAVAPVPPTGFTALARTCVPPACDRISSFVTLRWDPATGTDVTGFRVLRDGARLPDAAGLAPSATEFVDRDVAPGDRHDYAVVVIGATGDSSPTPEILARVPLPPLSAARLDGLYDVTLVVRSAVNLASLSGIHDPLPGERRTSTWGFRPRCEADRGVCPTRWVAHTGLLRLQGTVWRGRVLGPDARCADGTRIASPIDIRLAARDGQMVAGAWRVSGFTGTYAVRFRCPGFLVSRGVLDLTGRGL